MALHSIQLQWLQLLSAGLLWLLLFLFLHGLLTSLPPGRRRWPLYRINDAFKKKMVSPSLLKLFWISEKAAAFHQTQQLLRGCGTRLDAVTYYVIKRTGSILLGLIGFFGYMITYYEPATFYLNPIYLMTASFTGWIFIIFDKKILEAIQIQRKNRIVREVYTLSNQLLYYAGSSMNLHNKLVRCIPHTRTIRNDMYLLTSEWYQDAEFAITRFKNRLGTEEGYSFGETVNSLRLNESDRYYELLRQRIQDYKEKMELAKESKKETTSYVLYILAGIPILNTFRVFIYPWIAEGQKLFDSLS